MIVLDTESSINAFAMLQVYHKLKLEVTTPGDMKWRFSPAKQAKQIMAANGVLCTKRKKVDVLAVYKQFLLDNGILKEDK